MTGFDSWNINADEADIYQYDSTNFQPAYSSFYAPNQFRYSDHDPLVVGLDLETATPPTVSIGDASVTEGDGGTVDANSPVTLSESSTSRVTVEYRTSDGSATSSADYRAETGTVTFEPGETRETITVTVNGDTIDEPDENFTVTLSAPVNATLGDATGTGTIVDDDDPPPPPPPPPGPKDDDDDDDDDGADDDDDGPAESTTAGRDEATRVGSPEGRTQTALLVSQTGFDDDEAGAVVLTRPDIFPDALAGTPLAVR